MKPNAINYLSLARKAGRIEVGEEPVGAAARSGHARLVLVASDAPDNTRRRAKNFVAGTDQQMVVLPFTKEEMGIALGRSVVALAAMTDPAMALAFLNALDDPQRYGEAVAQLTVKADRMRRHQLELKAHEKNIRTGKTRKEREHKPQQEDEQIAPAEKDSRRPAADWRDSGYGEKRRDAQNSGNHKNRAKTPHQADRPGWASKRETTGKSDDRRAGKWEHSSAGKKPAYAPKGSGGRNPQYRKTSGRPAGQKYATVNKVAGRKPGRKTHGGAEV